MDERSGYVVHILYTSLLSLPTSSNLNRRWMLVILILLFICPLTLCQRGEHTIDDELVFSNHTGYVFHDSRGIECGSTEELETLREFIRRKCAEKKLKNKLHAIWFAQLPFSWSQQLTVLVSGTASPWTAIDHSSIWSLLRAFVATRTVCLYEHS